MAGSVKLLDHRLIVGFHGCDRAVGERVLLGRGALRSSKNAYDWLGSGIYFWEHSERRALQWAHDMKRRNKIETPFVLGAYISLGRCFDLTDTQHTARLGQFHSTYVSLKESLNRTLAENGPGGPTDHDLLRRNLDCDVLNTGLEALDEASPSGPCYFQSVRGVFVEGEEAYPGAAIRTKTHIQICVRDPGCILGYFMPASYAESEEANR